MPEKSYSAAFFCLLLGLSAACPAIGRPNSEWVGASTPHFAVLSRGHRQRGSEMLRQLEVARQFFEKTVWAPHESDQPTVEIVAFYSDKEFESNRVNPSSAAFYQRARQGDYIVMRDLEPEHYSVAIHEYTHFVVEHLGLNLPPWLNEGLADFYSTIECRNAKVLLGAAPTGRDLTLASRRWIDWEGLTSADQSSPYYQRPERLLMFYAQSWAMVHMLAMDAAYADGFPEFVAAVAGGATSDAALLAVYHKTLRQVGRELVGYVRSKRMKARLVNIDARPGSMETQLVTEARKRAEFAMADVLAANSETADEARVRLAELDPK